MVLEDLLYALQAIPVCIHKQVCSLKLTASSANIMSSTSLSGNVGYILQGILQCVFSSSWGYS